MTRSEIIYKEFINRYPVTNVQEKRELENAVCDYLLKHHKIKTERASYEGRLYPELLILDRTRNIFGYLSIHYHNTEDFNSDFQKDFDRITRKRIQVYYSELDRPVFFLHWFSTEDSEGIYFITSEQVQDILVNEKTENSQTFFYPRKDIMGDFAEFIHIVKTNT